MAISVATQNEHDALAGRVEVVEQQATAFMQEAVVIGPQLSNHTKQIAALLKLVTTANTVVQTLTAKVEVLEKAAADAPPVTDPPPTA